ncbi:MAG: small multi-drug export protein [Candidatus Omnitrophica bacterium]|nr:small multi-drug export protein [Candidatus Omnitrophota bacterium]
MIHAIVEVLKGLPPELVTVIVAALPIAELRGAIPVGVALNLSLWQAFFWSCLGNLLPVIPLLLFLGRVSSWLSRFPFWKRFFNWLFARTEAHARIVQRYQALGLAIFVAVPLPLTGAWSGCAAAFFFRLPFRLAFPAIAAGVIGAGLIVTLAVYTGGKVFF